MGVVACVAQPDASPSFANGGDGDGIDEGDEGDDGGDPDGDDGGRDDGGGEDDGAGGAEDGPLFDVASGDDGLGDDGAVTCEAAEHVPCDDDDSAEHALGLGCPGEPTALTTIRGPRPGTFGVRTGLGSTSAFDPREGMRFAVIGSGYVADLDLPGDDGPTHCNDATQLSYQSGQTLPAPIMPVDVGGSTCDQTPSLVGTGDCSNTIQSQYEQGVSPYDYTEVRIEATVPAGASSLAFDFAFFSTEYPNFYGRQYNDMFVAWLESSTWTGNISFDDQGEPISLNAGFLDFRDATAGTPNDPSCTNGCTAPELHGSCMEGHAGTRWLTSTAEVQPGETITLVLGIFDLSDPNLDSYVFLDNLRWGCDEGPPTTTPAG